MKILHITPSIGPDSYGLGQVALNLVKAQRAHSLEAIIWCLDPPDIVLKVTEQYNLPVGSIVSFRKNGPARLGLSLSLISQIKKLQNDFDIIHQHGIWTAFSYVTRVYVKMHGIPYVVAAHGSLEQSVIRKSFFKKQIASFLYEKSNLKNASCIHATIEKEISDFREYGLTNNIALIKNGISNDWLISIGNKEKFYTKFNVPRDRRVVLFMARIAPKKGLPMLLEAWAKIYSEFPDWILVVIGGDENGHKPEVIQLTSNLGISDSVVFLDPIFGESKRDAFSIADIFILPSYSEGFPMVVLDSLGAGVPAIVTQATSWADLNKYNCGWWVKINTDSLQEALIDGMSKSKKQLQKMGENGKKLVEMNYNWSSIALQTFQLYSWLIDNKEKPDFIY